MTFFSTAANAVTTAVDNYPGTSKGVSSFIVGLLALPWDRWALILAVVYNIHLLAGWWWNIFWRGFFIRKGWYNPTEREEAHRREREFHQQEREYRRQAKQRNKR